MAKKKKRASKRKQDAAVAARESTNKEEPPTASYEENSPAIQTENGATAVFAVINAVSPKMVVLQENIIAPDLDDFDDKDKENSRQYPLPTEIYSTVLASQPQSKGATLSDELMLLRLLYLDCIHKKMMARGFVMHEACDLDMVDFESSSSSNAVVIDVYEDQRTSAHKVNYDAEKNQDLVTPNNVVVPENKEIIKPTETNASQKYQEVTAAKSQEAAASEEVNDTENNILEDSEHDRKFVVVQENEEGCTAKIPAADILYRTHDAVLTEVVTLEILKQLQIIKEIVDDILNRLNPILT